MCRQQYAWIDGDNRTFLFINNITAFNLHVFNKNNEYAASPDKIQEQNTNIMNALECRTLTANTYA